MKEIGDTLAMASASAQNIGRYEEAELHASACIERSRDLDPGSYLHGLAWRVPARFRLGDWEGVLADQEELERVAALDPRELPVGYTLRAYTYAALCHELRGERDEADRYIELTQRYLPQLPLGSRAARHMPHRCARARSTRALRRSARPDPTRASRREHGLRSKSCARSPRARAVGRSTGLVAAAREEAEIGEQPSLPLVRRPARGPSGRRARRPVDAAKLLARSADGFAALEARWEEAWSRLLLAEVVGSDAQRAERELAVALPVFERLGSVREAERARALLADVAV